MFLKKLIDAIKAKHSFSKEWLKEKSKKKILDREPQQQNGLIKVWFGNIYEWNGNVQVLLE